MAPTVLSVYGINSILSGAIYLSPVVGYNSQVFYPDPRHFSVVGATDAKSISTVFYYYCVTDFH
jgi:hypothetical protein